MTSPGSEMSAEQLQMCFGSGGKGSTEREPLLSLGDLRHRGKRRKGASRSSGLQRQRSGSHSRQAQVCLEVTLGRPARTWPSEHGS